MTWTKRVYLGLFWVILGSVLLGGVLFGASGGALADGESDNETIRHVHPDEVETGDDLAAVTSWLGDRMVDMHVDCSEGIAGGAFDVCGALEDEYDETLSQYVTVEQHTTGETETSDRLDETRQSQAKLANRSQLFWETYDAYQEAREQGDIDRAQELARELRGLADEIEALGGELDEHFTAIENQTDIETALLRNQTQAVSTSVNETATASESESFRNTSITVAITPNSTSFTHPTTVSGRVTTDNETPVVDQPVAIRIAQENVTTTRTNETGHFSTLAKPITAPTGEQNLTASIVPTTDSPYLGSSVLTTVNVTASEAELVLRTVPESVQFGDDAWVGGAVFVNGERVHGIPMAVSLGPTQVNQTQTTALGGFVVPLSVRPSIAAGEQTLTVQASRSDAAIEPSTETIAIDVDASAAELMIAVEEDPALLTGPGETGYRIGGALTANGEPVPDAAIVIEPAGQDEIVTRTDVNGTYTTDLIVGEATAGSTLVVSATYEGIGSNIRTTDAETTVAVPGQTQFGLLSFASENPIISGLLAIILVGVLGGGAWIWWTARHRDEHEGASIGDAPGPTEPPIDNIRDGRPQHVQFDTAYGALDSGEPAHAIRVGYLLVRNAISPADDTVGQTHWEFFSETRDELDSDQETILEQLTMLFEQAAFARESISAQQAAQTLRAAETAFGDPVASDGGESVEQSTE